MFKAILKTFAGAVVLLALIVMSSYLPTPNFQHNAALDAQSGGPILPAPLGPYGNQGFVQTGTTSSATATLTANQMVGGFFLISGSASTAVTTDTAANACLLFPFTGNQNSNFAWDFYIKNSATTTSTTVAGSGFTLVGTGNEATLTVRHFKVVMTACPVPGTTSPTAAGNIYSLETTLY